MIHKYCPDFLIKLTNGEHLILEVKGQETDRDRTKREFLDAWVRSVNSDGRFGRWGHALSTHPNDVDGTAALICSFCFSRGFGVVVVFGALLFFPVMWLVTNHEKQVAAEARRNAPVAAGRVAQVYAEWLTDRKLRVEVETGKLGALRFERDAMCQRRDRILTLVEEGGLIGKAAIGRLSELQTSVDELQVRIEAIKAATKMAAQDGDAVALTVTKLREGLEVLAEATAEEQAVVFGGLVRRVTLSKERADVELVTPGGATSLYNRTEWLPCMDSNHD